MSEKSSTRMISCMRCSGDLSSTECTVRNNTDQASLWKQIITAVGGRSFKYLPDSLHLKQKESKQSLNRPLTIVLWRKIAYSVVEIRNISHTNITNEAKSKYRCVPCWIWGLVYVPLIILTSIADCAIVCKTITSTVRPNRVLDL